MQLWSVMSKKYRSPYFKYQERNYKKVQKFDKPLYSPSVPFFCRKVIKSAFDEGDIKFLENTDNLYIELSGLDKDWLLQKVEILKEELATRVPGPKKRGRPRNGK